MGYYTRYTLEWDTLTPDYVETGYGPVSNGDSTDTIKWYNHEYDMLHISKQYPNTTFILYGEGEEPGDLWKVWFRDGQHEKVKAKVGFETPGWV